MSLAAETLEGCTEVPGGELLFAAKVIPVPNSNKKVWENEQVSFNFLFYLFTFLKFASPQ